MYISDAVASTPIANYPDLGIHHLPAFVYRNPCLYQGQHLLYIDETCNEEIDSIHGLRNPGSEYCYYCDHPDRFL